MERPTETGAARPAPPLAPRRPTTLSTHGDDRVDEWYWLRDRDDPAVLAYLTAENAYTEAMTAHLAPLRDQLFEEFKARIQETDESPPVWHGGHWYYTRTVEGLEYDIHCRRPGRLDAPEQVVLDENVLADGHDYFDLRGFAVSPDHTLLAYAVNFDGSDLAELRFRDLSTGDDLAATVPGVWGVVAWANDNRTVLYNTLDEALRPHQVWRTALGDAPVLVYEEADPVFRVSPHRDRSGRILTITSSSSTTSEVRLLDADSPGEEPRVVEPRRAGVEYSVACHTSAESGDRLLITTNDDGAVNFKLVEAPLATPGRAHWRDLVDHRLEVRLLGVAAFAEWLVLAERADATMRLRALRPDATGATPIDVPEAVSTAYPGDNPEYRSSRFRFEYSSMVTPDSTFDVDLDAAARLDGSRRAEARTLVKQEPVLGYDPSRYRTSREWAVADDGTRVPISVVRRADTPFDGTAPCLLYGYGSYEISIDPEFSPFLVSLLDRGFVYAVAHPRGGGEMGRLWYDHGKFLEKRNTFTDFVACAERVVEAGYTSPDRLVAVGGSAGGLLMGAVVNLRPDLFRAVVAHVPFVDVVTTMLDESIPLTIGEFEEWGNPKDPEFYRYMKSYSPYDNVEAKAYPPMLVTTGLNDTRVAYWEPAKWVAKLRATKTDDEVLLLKTELGAGHGGPSGRYGEWRDRAFWYAFVLGAVGITE
ncbi:MAG TPA: S9 family peptidase [Acidimicrobiales bacterium]|nr:S9 family peptidase [Acidimicrobiales bacterium]